MAGSGSNLLHRGASENLLPVLRGPYTAVRDTANMDAAAQHGHNFLKSTIGEHPVAAALFMAALVVLILVLGYYVAYYKSACTKSGFHITPANNMQTGNNLPIWQLGAMDAGDWGPIHRATTDTQAAVYHPAWRSGTWHKIHPHHHREGLAIGPSAQDSACGPGQTPYTYQNPDGSTVTYCQSNDVLPGPATVCSGTWDPAATAEAQALATVGSFQHDSYGERKLQKAINAAYDSDPTLSDDQLNTLMHQGGAP
jgi:hypothetical protein